MRSIVFAGLMLGSLALPAHAQDGAGGLQETFLELFTFGNCGTPLCLDVDPNFHGLHYLPDVAQGRDNLLGFMIGSISTSLSQVPFTAASSGTVLLGFRNGVPELAQVSPGPILGERASTLGRGSLLFSLNVTGISLSSIRGVDMSELQYSFQHQNVQDGAFGNPLYETDVIQVETDLQLKLVAAALGLHYGIHDRVDLGLLVPIVYASLDGTSRAQVVNPFGTTTGAHQFAAGGGETATASASGSATGIGDIGLRLKANLYQKATLGFGFLTDLRLPTGSEDNFLGTGAASVRVAGIASAFVGGWAPHANGGFILRTGDTQTSSLIGAVGFDRLLSDKVTLAAEVMADLQMGDSKLLLPGDLVFTAPAPLRERATNIPDQKDNLVDAAIGLKIDANAFRVLANVLVPLANGGVRPTAMWTIGLERIF